MTALWNIFLLERICAKGIQLVETMCCSAGGVYSPNLVDKPPDIANLMRFTGGRESREFIAHFLYVLNLYQRNK